MRIIGLLILILLCELTACSERDSNEVELLNKNASEIIRKRGYMTEEHQVLVRGGYVLNLIRATNPLVNDGLSGLDSRSVVLFVHGTLCTAKYFILHSQGASPRDHTHLDASQMDTSELLETLRENNSSHSLALTLLDFGHEVWLLNRRGNFYSQGNIYKHKQAHLGANLKKGPLTERIKAIQKLLENLNNNRLHNRWPILKKLPEPILNFNSSKLIPNPNYWNFTSDDMAKYDIPVVVDYILQFAGRKRLAYVGHSLGGGLILKALSMHKSLNDKFTKILLWSPAINLQPARKDSFLMNLLYHLEVPMKLYKGDLPPEVISPFIQNLAAILCSSKKFGALLCEEVLELFAGPGADQLNFLPGHTSDQFSTVPSSELAQLGQDARTYKSTAFDYGPGNMLKYGQSFPPTYNMSRITTDKMMFFVSDFDFLVPSSAVERLLPDLQVPFELISFNESNFPGLKFNHLGFIFHKRITELLVEPSLRAIHEAEVE